MAIAKKLIKFLGKAKFKPIEHRIVYTAFDKSQTLKVPDKMVGKTLVIKMDPSPLKLRRASRDYAIVLIGANKILDKAKFKKVVNTWRKKIGEKPVKKIGFATEAWMKKNLKGVKVGAIPPFGDLWGLSTFVDKSFFKNKKIIISAGDYNFSIEISPTVCQKLIPNLVLGSFGKIRK